MPPKPAGRHMTLTETPVSTFAKSKGIPLLKFESLPLARPDFLVVAGFGAKIPKPWLDLPKIMPINMHPSLLPHYRGAFPAEWAILRGEKRTGATLLKMSEEFDKGEIVTQQDLPITTGDTRETLYKKLYDLGAGLLVETLSKEAGGAIHTRPQPTGKYFYARRLSREDGFVSWDEFNKNLSTDPHALDTKLRALSGWPGVWTKTPEGKRLKLISLYPEPIVQMEGKKPVPWRLLAS